MSTSIRVAVDRDRCVGSGNCEFWAPGVFEVADDDVAAVVGDPASDVDAVQSAADNCPTRAIRLVAD
jgi:ferredoxin